MIIEQGWYLNAFIRISLINGTSGQMQVDIEFDKNEKLINIDDLVIKGAFGFQCDKGTNEYHESGFYWDRESMLDNKLAITWKFMFSTLDTMRIKQKYQFLDTIFQGIRKINKSIKDN